MHRAGMMVADWQLNCMLLVVFANWYVHVCAFCGVTDPFGKHTAARSHS
jgi:hypothetical protein